MHNTDTAARSVRAVRARRALTMRGEGPARGEADLLRPLSFMDDALVLTAGGRIVSVEKFSPAAVPAGCAVRDLGEVTLMPALTNAHCHLQLAHLAGRTAWGRGFTPWLASMIPLLHEALDEQGIAGEAAALRDGGTWLVGDYAGCGALLTGRAASAAEVAYTGFCEWFGFAAPFTDDERPWPPSCRGLMARAAGLPGTCWQPCGHALYSTHGDVLRDAHAHCRATGGVFSLHLAESPEETELLCGGRGPLADLYAGIVLPEGWRAPGLPPVRLADALGLLGAGTLAIHAVQCDAADCRLLAERGAAVCLCPRSNEHLAVGTAPVREHMRAGTLLCLGTDGLSSNTDVQVMGEARWLLERLDVPVAALARMLTVNGAAALGRSGGALSPGMAARWAIWPADWDAA